MIEPLRSRLQNRSLVKWTWLAGHLFLIIGAVTVFQIGRPRFAGYFLYIVIAVLMIDVLSLSQNVDIHSIISTPSNWVNKREVILILYLISLIVLFTAGRGLLFYLAAAATGFGIISQILLITEKQAASRRMFYLVTIMLLSSTLIFSQVLSVAYYANISDSIWHTSFVHVITEYGSIDSIENGRYRSLPAFHVLGAITVHSTGLTPRATVAIIIVACYQMVSLLTYLIPYYYTSSERIGLISAALFGTNARVLFRASEAHSQELSFGFFCIIFFLLIKNDADLRFLLIFACVAITWTVTHHLSVAMGLIMIGLLVIDRLYRNMFLNEITWYESAINEWTALCGLILTYWVFTTPLLQDIIAWIFGYSPQARGESSNLLIQTYDDPYILLQESIPYALDYLFYAFLLAFICIGFYVIFLTGEFSINRRGPWLFVFGGAGLLYFPNPFWIPIEGIGVPLRWATVVFFIIVPIASIGLIILVDKTPTQISVGVILIIVFLLIFTNISIGLADPTLVNFAGYDKEPKKYISEDELLAVDFAQSHQIDNQTIWAPSFLPTYIDYYPPDPEPFHPDETRQVRISEPNRSIISGEGLTIVTKNTYRTNSIQVIAVDGTCDRLGLTTASKTNSQWDYESGHVIYSNGGTIIQADSGATTEEFQKIC